MLPSEQTIVERLSKLQRDLLIEHVRQDMRPFTTAQPESSTRASLILRGLIRYEPDDRSMLGVPEGTVLTERGRAAVCVVLGWYMDALVAAAERRGNSFKHDRQAALFNLLAESVPYWRREALYQTRVSDDIPRNP